MKKLFVVLSLIAFFGVLAAPVFATDNNSPVIVNQEKPKSKSGDCKAEAKKDCSAACTDKAKAACDKEKK